jgi:hypothetical protein
MQEASRQKRVEQRREERKARMKEEAERWLREQK